ncbi:MAG: hypothetical protein U9Q81_05995 [Pseudomonadota bacterium]|nr:hypothetical protein [Pseudomonadota bacterium]
MISKKKLAMAVSTACLAAAANVQAATDDANVNVDGSGEGQIVVVPYYNVNNGFQTNVNITNTDNAATVVKIRFRESGRSEDVLDFLIYLSAHDVWTGTVRMVGDKANIITSDTTCTYPMNNEALPNGQVLTTTGWDFKYEATGAAPGVALDDTYEGYFEIFEIGAIDPELRAYRLGELDNGQPIVTNGDPRIVPNISHQDGVPPDCSVVKTGWQKGVGFVGAGIPAGTVIPWTSEYCYGTAGGVCDSDLGESLVTPASVFEPAVGDRTAFLRGTPDGGIYATAIYLDVPLGGAYVSEGVAINGCYNTPQHFAPDDLKYFELPSLASCDEDDSIRLVNGNVEFYDFSPQGLSWDAGLNDTIKSTPRTGNNPGPVAHVLTQQVVENDYFVDPTFDGATDWVITFPMRKLGLYDGQFTANCDGDVFTPAVFDMDQDVCFLGPDRHVQYSILAWDREERRAPLIPDVSPVVGDIPVLPREVNVLTFVSGASSVLGSPHAATFDTQTAFPHGWARVAFSDIYNYAPVGLLDGANGNTPNLVPNVPDVVPLTNPGIFVSGPPVDLQNNNDDGNLPGIAVLGFAAIRGDNSIGGTYGETIVHKYQYKE